jgi:hypothetical protein
MTKPSIDNNFIDVAVVVVLDQESENDMASSRT